MEMLVSSLQEVNLDCSRALKENFIFNKLDGSEDHLVTDSLFALVGKEIQMFRSQLMQSTPPRLIADLVKTITPPEGVRSPSAAASSDSAPPDEGAELLDGDFVVEETEKQTEKAATTPSTSSNAPVVKMKERPLLENTGNPSLDTDAAFLNALGELLAEHHTHTTSTILQHRLLLQRNYIHARRALKVKINAHTTSPATTSPATSTQTLQTPTSPQDPTPTTPQDPTPTSPQYSVGQYITIKLQEEQLKGVIIDLDQDEVTVKAMRPSKDLWVWPAIDELYIINPSMIIDICDCPQLVGSLRAARYKFF